MPTTERASFDEAAFRQWFALAIELVGQARVRIDGENLFPVADGDTGTNVLSTLESGAQALIEAVGETASLARITARATLVEARGNSGVILSEILRGFADGLGEGLYSGLISADAAAQRAVIRPATGTILTAMAAVSAAIKTTMSDREVAVAAWSAARQAALQSALTPPIPSAKGTIDAGAHALERILAALAGTMDPTLQPMEPLPASAMLSASELPAPRPSADGAFEVMYLLPDSSTQAADYLRTELSDLGRSVLVVGSQELWNVHVHTDDPGGAVEAGFSVGRPARIKITSLASPNEEVCVTARRIIAVANGPGIADILRAAGAVVISAFDSRRVAPEEWWQSTIGASEVLLLPQDRHGVLSAQESLQEIRNAGLRVAVVPSRSTVQALAAIAVHDPLRSFDDDLVAMTSAAGHTRYATIAFAKESNRSSKVEYIAGDAIGIIDGEIMVAGTDLFEVAESVLRRMLAGGGEILTLITGAGADAELAYELAATARTLIPEVRVLIHNGGQAWYPLLIGVE